MADRVVMIEGGRLVAETTLYELLSGSGPVVDVRTPKPERLTAALDARNMRWSGEGDRILIQGASVEAVGEVAANAGVPLHRLASTERTLEEAFVQLAGTSAGPDNKEVL